MAGMLQAREALGFRVRPLRAPAPPQERPNQDERRRERNGPAPPSAAQHPRPADADRDGRQRLLLERAPGDVPPRHVQRRDDATAATLADVGDALDPLAGELTAL